jgi:hypothetical protein
VQSFHGQSREKSINECRLAVKARNMQWNRYWKTGLLREDGMR